MKNVMILNGSLVRVLDGFAGTDLVTVENATTNETSVVNRSELVALTASAMKNIVRGFPVSYVAKMLRK